METGLFINGKYVKGSEGKTIDVLNPATNQVLAKIEKASKADVQKAIEAAEKCFKGTWRNMGPMQRAALLHKVGDAIEKNADFLAGIETDDVGKPLFESKNIDIAHAAMTFHYFADISVDLFGMTIPGPLTPIALNYTVQEPIGVIGAIIPWNFPFLIAARKIASALAAGNTMVIKPALLAPLSTMQFGTLFKEAGMPDGVLNIVTASGSEIGDIFTKSTAMDEISFTGSTEVGRKLMENCACGLKGVTLELGGKSPGLVLPDCDMDETIAGTLLGVFLNQGECCCALTRLIVHKDVHDEFVKKFVAAAKSIKVGMPRDEATRMGPLVSADQLKAVMDYVESGKKEGATLACGGRVITKGELGKGNFMEPTVFTDVTPKMRIWKEEIFGPVVTVTKADSIEEMVALANNTDYGLAASLWTTGLKNGHMLASQIEAGTVWCNLHNFVIPSSPYGGYKNSGVGSELGRQGLMALTRTKSVIVSLIPGGFKWY